jgi:hypothetical protein
VNADYADSRATNADQRGSRKTDQNQVQPYPRQSGSYLRNPPSALALQSEAFEQRSKPINADFADSRATNADRHGSNKPRKQPYPRDQAFGFYPRNPRSILFLLR